MLNYIVSVVVLIITLSTFKASTQDYMNAQCSEHGMARLNSGRTPSRGTIDICVGHDWVTVCADNWDDTDAAVVCRELGYTADGAQAWQFQRSRKSVGIGNFRCHSTETRLYDCADSEDIINCFNNRVAGVSCSEEELRVKNISVTAINIPYYAIDIIVMVSWELQNEIAHQPNSFGVVCFNQQQRRQLYVNHKTFTISVGGFLNSSTSYNCCVWAIYNNGQYIAEARCSSTEMLLLDPFTSPASTELDRFIGSNLNKEADIIGGVLGSIIVILLLLLAICGAALLYLLRSHGMIPKRSIQPVDENSTEIPVRRNLSYATTPSRSLTSGPQDAIRAISQNETGAVAEYSRIGPSYETTYSRRQQPVAGRYQVTARLSERYEFSDPHLAAAGGAGVPGPGEVGLDYEVPLSSRQNEEHEEYSHLQH